MWRCLCDPMFSRFSRTSTCDRRTDNDGMYRASMALHAKKLVSLRKHQNKIEYVSVVNCHVSNIRELGLFHLLYTTERCFCLGNFCISIVSYGVVVRLICLQCFDAVRWAAGRASSL